MRRRARVGQRRTELRIGPQARHGAGHRIRVLGIHQQAAVAHDLGQGAGLVGDDRHAQQHRLHDGHAEALVARRQHEDVGLGHGRRQRRRR